jgi:sulfonate dioxygenase
MAPSLAVQGEESVNAPISFNKAPHPAVKIPRRLTGTLSYVPGHTVIEKHETCDYEDLKPSFPDKHWPALEEVPHSDNGLLGDPTFRICLQMP